MITRLQAESGARIQVAPGNPVQCSCDARKCPFSLINAPLRWFRSEWRETGYNLRYSGHHRVCHSHLPNISLYFFHIAPRSKAKALIGKVVEDAGGQLTNIPLGSALVCTYSPSFVSCR